MKITIDYLKSKGFNCESIREQHKGNFRLNLNRYGEHHYQFKEPNKITDLKVNTIEELENLYYAEVGVRL